MTQENKSTIQRVHEFFKELSKLGLFDQMSGMSDLTHPFEINSLCDAVEADVKAEADAKLYTLQMWGGVEPNLFGPYTNEDERVADVHLIRADENNNSAEDSYCRIDIDKDGVPTVSSFTDGEFDDEDDTDGEFDDDEDDNDEEDEED